MYIYDDCAHFWNSFIVSVLIYAPLYTNVCVHLVLFSVLLPVSSLWRALLHLSIPHLVITPSCSMFINLHAEIQLLTLSIFSRVQNPLILQHSLWPTLGLLSSEDRPITSFDSPSVCRYTWVTGREPLTYYDMNLSAQDHQTFFTCDSDHLRPADAGETTRARAVDLSDLLSVIRPFWQLVCLCGSNAEGVEREKPTGSHLRSTWSSGGGRVSSSLFHLFLSLFSLVYI